MTQAEQVVSDFMAAFNAMDIDAIVAAFTEDAVYHNMPGPPVEGRSAIKAVIRGYLGLASAMDWRIAYQAEVAPGVVLNERLDRFKLAKGWLELPVMGAFEVVDGKIAKWRDYFDMADFQRQLAAQQGEG